MTGTRHADACYGTDLRRAQVRARHRNGLDAVEADDTGLRLTATFIGRAPRDLTAANFRIDGGRRITGIRVTDVQVVPSGDPELDDRVDLAVDRRGDASGYRLSVVRPDHAGRPGHRPYPGFDPRYSSAEFSFAAGCPADQDCADETPERPVEHERPVLDHTARDYASLRRMLLERAALVSPRWVERHEPDQQLTVLEALAYSGDLLSYAQDAVSTEAYLATARQRVSVRRHARLVDYLMHDGCNARTVVHVAVDAPLTLDAARFRFAAVDVDPIDPQDRPVVPAVLDEDGLAALPQRAGVDVFEPLTPAAVPLRPAHNRIRFWTWGEQQCCLPAGATSATLMGRWVPPPDHRHQDGRPPAPDDPAVDLRLDPGDLLLIEEVRGPRTGAAADADLTHRQVVRLVAVRPGQDRLYDQPVVEVEWAEQDALRFPACLSSRGGPGCEPLDDVSVARANLVLVDHGRSPREGWAQHVAVPPDPVRQPACPPGPGCFAPEPPAVVNLVEDLPVRLRPVLDDVDITQATGYPAPATIAGLQAQALRAIPERARTWLEQLWHRILDGHRLDPADLADLRLILAGSPPPYRPRHQEHGERHSDRHGESYGERHGESYGDREDPDPVEADPRRFVRDLLDRFHDHLERRLARLDVLAARADAGTVLGDDTVREVELTWGPRLSAPLHPDDPVLAGPVAAALEQDPRAALPAVTVDASAASGAGAGRWLPARDLLDAGPRDRRFVGESDDDGWITLRFGGGGHGALPPAGGSLAIRYRIGNGARGNVGADTIGALVLSGTGDPVNAVREVRNPVPATGGTDPEPTDTVRLLAPLDLRRRIHRAVTAQDYARLASALPGVQRAAAVLRPTGSGVQALVAVDPWGGATAAPGLLDTVADRLLPYRRIGHDLVVRPAEPVPLLVELTVCAAPGYLREHVADAVRATLGSRALPDGRRGFFHADALTFGTDIRVSALTAAAAAVPGVTSVRVTRLRRMFAAGPALPPDGVLRVGPLEVAQCDDDPQRPENGRLSIHLQGGR